MSTHLKDRPAQKTIALLHPGKGNGRRFALVSKVLSSLGLFHSAVVPLFGTGKLGRLEKAALEDPHCHRVKRLPAGSEMIIGTPAQLSKLNVPKKLILSFDARAYLSGELDKPALFHPILFHPDLVGESHYRRAAELSHSGNRNIGVLFAGNCDPKTYSNRQMAEKYGILNRIEIETLTRRLPQGEVFFPASIGEFQSELASGALKKKVVWIDTNRFRIPQSEWLDFIAQSRFFICTPGVRYPYCQNLNEAAACGSVPILQFPGAYSPTLTDGQDCLVFSNLGEFSAVIQKALETPDSVWEDLSKNATDYHDRHLSLGALQNRLMAFHDDPAQDQMTWVMAGNSK